MAACASLQRHKAELHASNLECSRAVLHKEGKLPNGSTAEEHARNMAEW